MLYNYTVTPLKEDHFEERVEDIIELVQSGVSVMPLFSMTLVPEGNPVWDKVTPLAALFQEYKEALAPHGIPVGILVQASLGHGYEICPNPFQKYKNLSDGREEFVCCPEDPAFIEHFSGVMRTLAEAGPAAIMLDDDFRLSIRPGKGCVCPLHVKEFNRRTGLSVTEDELRAYIAAHPKGDALTRLYTQTQVDSLVKAARAFRAAIDEVDPTIQGINCTSGYFCDSVADTNPIFAGAGNPTMVRLPNGVYAPLSVRGFSALMLEGAVSAAKLKKHGIRILLAETDTIPFNRYGKGAYHLHAHYTASLLDGMKGAKHWLYRSTAFEPDSGRAYRRILSRHAKMYETLATLSDGIRWQGLNSAFLIQEELPYDAAKLSRWHSHDWVVKNIERMGLPFYFSENFEGVTFLEGDIVGDMTDRQLDELFHASVFIDGTAAQALIRRGYGAQLGVDVTEWDGGRVSGECFDADATVACTKQKDLKKLCIRDAAARAISYNYVSEGGTLIVSLYNLGYDPVDTTCLCLEKEPTEISHLQPDGTFVPVSFCRTAEGLYALDVPALPMYPVILRIQQDGE